MTRRNRKDKRGKTKDIGRKRTKEKMDRMDDLNIGG
jgi:hypothetical protein